ncbi:MAG: membrane trafficking protein [Clostridiales bacterium GWC2_40_7]|nr:MAG: membrane trafficking protein [Clostridiales bacterium GWC2_40_7]
MSNAFNKKLADIIGKMDEKVLQAKINAALDMLKNGNNEELAKKIGKMDKNELLTKMNELDEEKLKEMNINKNDIKQKVSDADLNNLQKLLGAHGDEIISKLKDIIK